jgi:peptidylprolyl isomerase
MNTQKDYYAILGVSSDADRATIEEAYERLAKEVQPNVDLEPTNPERMQELDEAFDALDDPARRAEYDNARAAPIDAPPPAWAAAGADAEETVEGIEADADAATTEPAATTTSMTSLKKGPDGSLIAGIALLVGGVAALVAGIVVLVIALTDDSGGGTATVTDSGVQITDTASGYGPEAEAGDVVTVHYTGTLADGTQFDSSVGGEPFAFILGAGQVIPGWDEGVQGMQVGDKRTLVIPPDLAYGETGSGPIPPNATITFDIEVLGVTEVAAENPPEVTGNRNEQDSGLVTIDIAEGQGDEAKTGDTVYVHYVGWLEADGKQFDTSLVTPSVFSFTIGEKAVIAGWDAGVPGMKEGGKRRLIVPAALAYGQEGAGNGVIPPDAVLVFDIDLVEVGK